MCELAPWNLENIRKSTNNLSFLCQFFINEITASDAGPDIIRSHLFINEITASDAGPDIIRSHLYIYRDRSRLVELLLQLENKQQIMQYNVETKQSHVFVIYW